MGGRGASSSIGKSNSRKLDGTTRIGGIGEVNAYKVENLRKGDILQWNYGYTSKVIGIEQTKSGKSYKVKTQSSKTGEQFERTIRRGTLMAIGSKEAKTDKEAWTKTITRRA